MLDTSEEGRIIAAYRAGADAELEACCEWLEEGCYDPYLMTKQLRAARRPKPPTEITETITVYKFLFTKTSFYKGVAAWVFWECTAEEALEAALKVGWTSPRWWEFWRWNDTPRSHRALRLYPCKQRIAAALPSAEVEHG